MSPLPFAHRTPDQWAAALAKAAQVRTSQAEVKSS
jgi:hypothetical protein